MNAAITIVRTHRLLTLGTAWLATRVLMLWLLAHNATPLLGRGGVAREVWRLYHHWYGVLAHGAFPAHDHLWQYPRAQARYCCRPPCCRA